MVNSASEEFLAGAAFTEKQNCGFGGGNFLQLLADGLHGGGFADDAREAVAGGKFLSEYEIFADQFLLAGGTFNQQFEMVEVHRLLYEIESALFHGGDRFFDRAKGGEKDYGNGGIGLLGFAENFEAGSAGHFKVGEDHLVAAGAEFLDGGGAVGGFVNGVAVALEGFAKHGAEFGFVFDEEEGFHG
jgi:hypothetical protein